MKAYVLTKKDQPQYTHEIHVFLAADKKELKLKAEKQQLNLKEFDVVTTSKAGLVHSNIY